jgi:hypothetical protein
MGSLSDQSIYWILNNCNYTWLSLFRDCRKYNTQPIITLSRYNKVFNTTTGWQITQSLSHESTYGSQSQSYITTDGQSASLSWYQDPIWGLWPDFYYCQTTAGLLIWGALSEERTDLSFIIAAVFASAVILRSESRGAHDLILLSQIWDSPNLEDQVPVFISPRNGVARLYPQALGYSLPNWSQLPNWLTDLPTNLIYRGSTRTA